jgi:hypothetical protein
MKCCQNLLHGCAVAVNRCGASYGEAGKQCVLCPEGLDSECGYGETCYAGLSACKEEGALRSFVLTVKA